MDILENFHTVCAAMEKAAAGCGRDKDQITLVAVSKMHETEEILPLIEAGQRVFGENRVQEAMRKYPPLKEKFPDLKLHLIGPLQTNKVKEAVRLFDVIESVDRPEVAEKLAEEMKKQEKRFPVSYRLIPVKNRKKAVVFHVKQFRWLITAVIWV